MRRRRTAEEVARLLREADHDLAKGLTGSDICRKVGIAETTYYRWRQQYDPGKADADRRCRELDGGRIYSRVPGVACGQLDNGGRCSADRGPGDWSSRGADPHQG